MNYNEDKQLEEVLHNEARSVRPSPAVVHRIIDSLPRRSTSWKWLFMVPAFALVAFMFLSKQAPDEPQEITLKSLESIVDSEEFTEYEELAEMDADLFAEFDDEESDLLDILKEGSIVGVL